MSLHLLRNDGSAHRGDGFRELVDLWVELGLCTTEVGPDEFVWVDEPNTVLLLDYDRVDDRPIPPFQHVLMGNTVVDCEVCHAWTFWARHPRLVREVRTQPLLALADRDLESIFLGKIENSVQGANRMGQDWASAGVELFHCPVDRPGPQHYLFTPREYLERLARSRFGLCLPGYGPKCNREIELLAMGAVPVFTPGVDNTYAEPLVEGRHFLRIEAPEQFLPTIRGVGEDQWAEMHAHGQDWYSRNASAEGAYQLTATIVDRLGTSPRSRSVSAP